MIKAKPENTEVLVQLPLGAGTVPLRPFAIGEVRPGMTFHAPTPYGTPAAATAPSQTFEFHY